MSRGEWRADESWQSKVRHGNSQPHIVDTSNSVLMMKPVILRRANLSVFSV